MMMLATVRGQGFALRCRVCPTFFSRARGLMFSFLPRDEGLLLTFPKTTQIDIHMLFVFFPLDVVWLDEGGVIVKIARGVLPFLPHVTGRRARYLLEVRAGAASRLRAGQRLTINLKREG